MSNTFSWNTTNGDWAIGGNWTDLTSPTPGPPTSADDANFFGTGGTVTGNGNANSLGIFGSGPWSLTAGTITVAGVTNVGGSLDVSGTLVTSFLNQNAGATDLQVLADGNLTVTGTVTSPNNGFLNGVNITNTATVDNATLDSGGLISIGTTSQSASMTVQNGGSVDAWATILGGTPGQSVSMLLTGTNTQWHDVGGVVPGSTNTGGNFILGGSPGGFGTTADLTVTAGALLSDVAGGLIATQTGGSGSATISAGGIWQMGGALVVGAGGTASLNVSTQGTVAAGGPFNDIGNNTGSRGTVTVTGAGSLLSFAGSVSDTNGILSILNGGSVTSTGTFVNNGTTSTATDNIGGNTGANGTVVVDAGYWRIGGALTDGSGSGSGTLTVQNGGTVATLGTLGSLFNTVGNTPGGQGSVTVTGAGSLLNIAGNLTDGNNGTGSVAVLNGGAVVTSGQANNAGTVVPGSDTIGGSPGGKGTLLVDAGSWTSGNGLTIGNLTSGAATIQNGGLLTVTTGLLLGGFSGPGAMSTGIGFLTVQSGGSVVSNGPFDNVGGGFGSFGGVTIDGSHLTGNAAAWTTTANLIIGAQGTGRVTVQNGGELTVGDGLTIGGFNGTIVSTGVGTLSVASGGTVSVLGNAKSTFQNIGGGAGSTGHLSVDGASSLLSTAGVLNLGASGFGVASVTNGGSVTTSGQIVVNGTNSVGSDNIGGSNGSFGSLVVNGGNWSSGGGFTAGAQSGSDGSVALSNGTISVAASAVVGNNGAGALTIGNGGVFVSNGTFNAVGANAGSSGSMIVNAGGVWRSTSPAQANSAILAIGNNGAVGSLPAASGNVLVTGAGALIDTNGNPLSVGNVGDGVLTVAQGATVVAGTPDSSLIYSVNIAQRGGTGQITITDPGSTLVGNGFFIDGRGGNGSLLIKNSGTLIVNDAPANGGGIGIGSGRGAGPTGSPPAIGGNGVATVTGGGVLDVNSTTSGIGLGGNGVNGVLNVSSGGTVLAGNGMTIGSATAASGTIYGGTGDLNITAGGVVRVNNPTLTGYAITIGNANASIGTSNGGTATGAASGQAIVTGAGALLDANGAGISVGALSTGALTISQGGSAVSGTPDNNTFSALAIGRRATGSVTITDPGSTFTANGVTYVGRSGSGSLVIENQGTLIDGVDGKGIGGISIGGAGIGTVGTVANSATLVTGGSGSALVTGGGDMFSQQGIAVGTGGTDGALTVNDGGTAEATTTLIIGNSVSVASGGTIISPSSSIISTGTLIGTSGVVNVGAGGVLKANGTGVAAGSAVMDIGVDNGSSGVLNVAGLTATTTANGLLVVGDAGAGGLTIQSGATVTALGVNVGANSTGSGVVNITDTSSRLDVTGDLNLGTAGAGVLVMGAGTTLSVSGTIHVGASGALDQFGGTIDPTNFTNDGTVVGGNGASIEVSGTLTNNGTYAASGGALSLNIGTIDGSGTLAVGSGSELQVTGTVGSGQTVQFSTVGTTSATGVLAVSDLSNFNPGVINGFGSTNAIVIASTSTLTQSFNNGTLTLTNDHGTAFALTFGGTHTASDFTSTVSTATENDGSIGSPNPLVGDFINNGTIFAANGSLDVQGRISGIGTLAIDTSGIMQVDNVIGSGQTVQFADATGILTIGSLGGFAATIGSFAVGDEIDVAGATIVSDSFDTASHMLTLFDGSHQSIGALSFSPSVTGVNFAVSGSTVVGSAPSLSGAGNTVDYPGLQHPAVAINPGLTITDAASPTLASATASVTGGGFANDGDVLNSDTVGTAITLSYNGSTETLTLTGTDTLADYQQVLDSLTFLSTVADPTGGGNHTNRDITFSVNDGLAGSNPVTSHVAVQPCFAAGTRIATDRGDIPVEQLREGDKVRVLRGDAAPVVWLGHRHVDCARHPEPRKVWPVRVSAAAFGPARPSRDLWLSPDHAVYVNDVLIPVKYLINDSTIAQVPVDAVAYYHVELPHHHVLLAENLPAESYLDTGDRSNFTNGGGAITLYPDFSSLAWEAKGCAPLVIAGPQLAAARASVNACADRGARRPNMRGSKRTGAIG